MKNRYINTPRFTNNDPLYENVFEVRGVRHIHQYATTTFLPLTSDQKGSIVEKTITWESGDRLDKISSREYNSPSYWWVIARYNNKPTDAHFSPGDEVLVPHPLTLITSYYTD